MRITLSHIALALLYYAVADSARADTGACSLTVAVGDVGLVDIQQEASTAAEAKVILSKESALGAKATNPNASVGSQLDPDDNEKFGELSAQLKHIQAYNWIQSNRARDADVVMDMFNAALKAYSDPNYQPQTDIAKSPGDAIILLRYLQPNQPTYVPSTDTTCTIDYVLSQEESQVLQQINSSLPTIQRDKPVIDALRAKYGIAPGAELNRSKMTPEDIQTLDLLQNEIQPAMSNVSLLLDLANIRSWWGMSQLTYYDDLQDLQKTSDADDVGNTLRAQAANFSLATKAMMVMWNMIDQKVPNDDYIQFQQMQAALQHMPH